MSVYSIGYSGKGTLAAGAIEKILIKPPAQDKVGKYKLLNLTIDIPAPEGASEGETSVSIGWSHPEGAYPDWTPQVLVEAHWTYDKRAYINANEPVAFSATKSIFPADPDRWAVRLDSAVFNSNTPLQVAIGNITDVDQTAIRQVSAVFYKL